MYGRPISPRSCAVSSDNSGSNQVSCISIGLHENVNAETYVLCAQKWHVWKRSIWNDRPYAGIVCGRKRAAPLAGGGLNLEMLLLDLVNPVPGLGLGGLDLEIIFLGGGREKTAN